jgi:hypothetical protein
LRKKVIGDKLVVTMQGRSPPLASPAQAFWARMLSSVYFFFIEGKDDMLFASIVLKNKYDICVVSFYFSKNIWQANAWTHEPNQLS